MTRSSTRSRPRRYWTPPPFLAAWIAAVAALTVFVAVLFTSRAAQSAPGSAAHISRRKSRKGRKNLKRKGAVAREDTEAVASGSDHASSSWLFSHFELRASSNPTPMGPDIPPLHKCTCSPMRNLVVCIDGTSNQFSINNTNVVELYSRLIKDEHQLTFYNSGIGTYATPSWRSFRYYSQVLSNKLDLAFAFNFEKILLSAYLWLSENYRPGDRIFLFGFSRGAYQVRGLAAMIEQVGLIHKGNQDQIPFAYQLYAETKKVKDAAKMRAHFKKTFSHPDVRIHYLGLWDTVSSVGLIRDKTLPGTMDGLRFACFVRHALALHDRRVKFLPEYVHGGDGPLKDEADEADDGLPHTKEVWFAGSHGDVGGGSVDNSELNRFGPALRWVSFEAILVGLRLSKAPQEWNNRPPEVNSSLRHIWHILELLPITHLTYNEATSTRHSPHFGRCRKIKARQRVHETALMARTALPSAELSDDVQWDNLHASDNFLIERDPYTTALSVLDRLEKYSDEGQAIPTPTEFVAMTQLISTVPGRRSLLDSPSAAKTLANVLRSYSKVDVHVNDVPDVLFDVIFELETGAVGHLTRDSHLKQRNSLKYPHSVRCLAIGPEENNIVAGCIDGTLHFTNITSGESIRPALKAFNAWILCVAFSPDKKRIAYGSEDNMVCIWLIDSSTPLVISGHESSVRSIAFSPDGSRVLSGSLDRTARIWDVVSGQVVVGPMHHSSSIDSVLYTPDGSRIVTGSWSATLCVWDAESGEYLWQVTLSADIYSLSCAPNGMWIAAACRDGSALILNAENGDVSRRLTKRPLTVLTVAFSPDSSRIAAGSDVGDICLWDAATGEELDSFRGHCYAVWAVSFSSDGKNIISASLDKTMRIWEVGV